LDRKVYERRGVVSDDYVLTGHVGDKKPLVYERLEALDGNL
jgi:hypothetical protein